MNDILLHHYPASPFAEKARLMLGYEGLAWMDRMAARGHGMVERYTSAQAIELARSSTPKP
jgi:hypothetical protein